MKKFRFVLSLLLVMFVFSCKQNMDIETQKPADPEYTPQTRKEVLLALMERGEYYLSENEVENSLASILQGLEGDVSKARVATNNIEVEKVMEMPLKNGELNLFSESSGDLEEDTKFFIYNVNKNNKKGFAITCNDLRLGQVLAFIEEGEFKSDISDNPFLQLVVSRIDAYVEDTKKKWQELREEHPTIRSIYEGHKKKGRARMGSRWICNIKVSSNK